MEQGTSKYSSMSKEEFKKLILIGQSKTRLEVVYFILNTLHPILTSSGWYCYCDQQEEGKCEICCIPMIFNNLELDIERNIFDVNFLFNYYTKLCRKLLQLFDQKKDCIKCFQREYVFSGRDWNSDTYWHIPLSEIIPCNEKIQVEWLEPIPPRHQDQTIDLNCPEIF